MASLDWAAIRTAVLVGLALIGSVAVVASVATDDPPGWAVWAFVLVAAVGFVAAGGVAGWARSDRPMIHGLTAAGLTVLVLLAVGVARGGDDGRGYSYAAAGVAVLIAASCGVAGAVGADWLRRRAARRRTSRDARAVGTLSSGESAG